VNLNGHINQDKFVADPHLALFGGDHAHSPLQQQQRQGVAGFLLPV